MRRTRLSGRSLSREGIAGIGFDEEILDIADNEERDCLPSQKELKENASKLTQYFMDINQVKGISLRMS